MDLLQRAWLKKAVYDEMGLAPISALLPALVPGGTQVGRLTGYGAGTLNLRRGIPVHHGPGDAGAATLGAGSGEVGQAYAYLGTSGWVAFSSPEPGSPDQGVFTLAHVRADQYIPIAPLLTAGGNLDWIRGLFGLEDYGAAIAAALDRPVSGLLYLPYLNGERTPFTDPLARGAFIGLDQSSDRADMTRAVLEGVVYAYRHALDALLPARPASLILTGGGTRSVGWCQMFADVLGIPIGIAADAENVGVRGALLSAQVQSGYQPDFAPAGYFPVAAILQPNPETRERYNQKYAQYRAAYPALKPIFGAQK
jgi:xylulokinase